MSGIWDEKTEVIFENSKINKSDLKPKRRENISKLAQKIYKLVLQKSTINPTIIINIILYSRRKEKLIHDYQVTTAKVYVIF